MECKDSLLHCCQLQQHTKVPFICGHTQRQWTTSDCTLGHVSHCTGHTNLSSGAKPAMEQLCFTITATKPSWLVVTLSKPVIV